MLKYLILFGTGFEVFRVVWIHTSVWVRTQYSLVLVIKVLEEHSGLVFSC